MADGTFRKIYPLHDDVPLTGYKAGDIWHYREGQDWVGRNLLVESELIKGRYIDSSTTYQGNVSTRGFFITPPKPIDGAKYLTASITANISLENLRIMFLDSNLEKISYHQETSGLSQTWEVPSNSEYYVFCTHNQYGNKYKLEKGNKATDWTPAPEDLLPQDATEGYFIAGRDSESFDFNDWAYYGDNIDDVELPKYMGHYTSDNPIQSDSPEDYKWNQIESTNSYTYMAWSNSSDGLKDFTLEWREGMRYLGMYSSDSSTQSNNYLDYNWTALFDNVEVGAENLLLNSGFSDATWYKNWTRGGLWSLHSDTLNSNGVAYLSGENDNSTLYQDIEVESGKPYVFSYYIKSDSQTKTSFGRVFEYDSNNTQIKATSYNISVTNNWQRDVIYIAKTESNTKKIRIHFLTRQGVPYYISMPQLEQATVASTYKKNQKDIDNKIDILESYTNAQLEIRDNAIISSVNTSKSYTDGREIIIKDYANTQITQNNNTIRQEIQTAKTDAVSGAKTYTDSQIVASDRKIELGIKEAKEYTNDKVDGLEVGGRNYILKSPVYNSNDGTKYILSKGVDSIGSWVSGYRLDTDKFYINAYPQFNFTNGFNEGYYSEDWTDLEGYRSYSMEIMCPYELKSVGINQTDITDRYTLPANTWVKFSFSTNTKSPRPLMFLYATGNNDSVPKGTKVYYRKCKMEKGNKATDWSPAPEDARLYTAYSNLSDHSDITRDYPNENLINKKEITDGYYLTKTGALTVSENYSYTGFIPVEVGDRLLISGYTTLGASPSACFYKEDESFLSGVNGNNTSATANLTAPTNASYVRYSLYTTDLDGELKLEKLKKGQTQKTLYVTNPFDDPFNSYPQYTGKSAIDTLDPSKYEWESTKATSQELKESMMQINPDNIWSMVSSTTSWSEFSEEVVKSNDIEEDLKYLQDIKGELYGNEDVAESDPDYKEGFFTKYSKTNQSVSELSGTLGTTVGIVDGLEETVKTYEDYITFTNKGTPNAYMSISSSKDGLEMQVSRNKLSFLENGQELAYFSNKQLYINKGIMTESMQVGSHIMEDAGNGMTFFNYVGG